MLMVLLVIGENRMTNIEFYSAKRNYVIRSLIAIRLMYLFLIDLHDKTFSQLRFEPPTFFVYLIAFLQFQCLHHGATPPVKSADSANFEVLLLSDVYFSKTTIITNNLI